MTFGIFQQRFSHDGDLRGSNASTAMIGLTTNGVMYLSMPILFTALDTGRWAHLRRHCAVAGVLISSTSFLISSFGREVWHLIVLQGVLAALGGAMLYSPTTLLIDQWFVTRRATAYGAVLSSKNIVGTCCPFLMYGLLERLGPWWTLRIWAAIVLTTGLLGIFIMPQPPFSESRRAREIPWSFLKHRTFYIYAIGNMVQSAGYGIPQTYLSEYASEVLKLSAIKSSLMLTLFNLPGILSSFGFGLLADKASFSAATNTLISAIGSGLCALCLWGTKSNLVPAVLVLFSIGYGFFAGGYSGTWGGWIKDLEHEARGRNEAIHTGMIYGLLNGARGIGEPKVMDPKTKSLALSVVKQEPSPSLEPLDYKKPRRRVDCSTCHGNFPMHHIGVQHLPTGTG
ncbi:hypothetical protein LTR36_010496 [Oleoguttula mirabilis]|uniref:Major facilitator superfamily (MFS) profile domain-containing protein n=1 Tax=Oleoguttula mirabilis TaxID=1507867 RepID=A0AAV9J404_9PEZI|nr:hypothetical protein LTR36_010496 [Oleoguttula mirabilis]